MNSKDAMSVIVRTGADKIVQFVTEILGKEPIDPDPTDLELGDAFGLAAAEWERGAFRYKLEFGNVVYRTRRDSVELSVSQAELRVTAPGYYYHANDSLTLRFGESEIRELKRDPAYYQIRKEYFAAVLAEWESRKMAEEQRAYAAEKARVKAAAPVIPEEQETPDKVAWRVPCDFSDRRGEKKLWQTNTGRYLVSSFIADLPGVTLPPELLNGKTMVFPANAKGEFDTSELACLEGPEPYHEEALCAAGYRPIILAKWI